MAYFGCLHDSSNRIPQDFHGEVKRLILFGHLTVLSAYLEFLTSEGNFDLVQSSNRTHGSRAGNSEFL